MKSYSITTLILLLILTSCKNEINPKNKKKQFTLEATLLNIPDSTLFYLKPLSNITVDSAYVVNGHLSMKGQLKSKQPELLTLLATAPEFIYTQLIVENENVTFTADKKDFPWNIDMSGSIHQDEAEKFYQIRYQRQRLKNELTLIHNSDKKVLTKQLTELSDSLDNITMSLLKREFNSYAALDIFKNYKTKFSNKELTSLYEKLDPELRETESGKAVKLQSKFSKPKVGDKYYDYKAINQKGDTVVLSGITDKYILLHFSSLSCYGSQLSLPDLKKIYKNSTNDLDIVSISTDVDKERWQDHVIRDSIPWHYLWDGKGNYNDAYVKYWEIGTPNYVLISPDRIILERWYGYADGLIEEKLVKHIN
nr:DUF4369 domain-containing protein [uncultured Psychroserpens sp.]